jgi:hypothetical protein
MLRPTVSRPVCLGIKHPSGAYDQIFNTVRQLRVCWYGTPYLTKRTGLSFTIAAGPCQRSHCRVRVPWDSRPYFTVLDSRFPFLSPPTTRRVTVEVFDPASTLRVESIRVESYVTTDGQPASLSWNKAPIWGLRPDFYYCQTVAGLLMWGALFDEIPCSMNALPRKPCINSGQRFDSSKRVRCRETCFNNPLSSNELFRYPIISTLPWYVLVKFRFHR